MIGLTTPSEVMPSGNIYATVSPTKRPMAAPVDDEGVKDDEDYSRCLHHIMLELRSPYIKTGMKYPAGKGSVVARVNIQNWKRGKNQTMKLPYPPMTSLSYDITD